MEWKYTQWTICEKKENGQELYYAGAINEALSWFFAWNGLGGCISKVYDFLRQFVKTERIDDEYGRLFFVTAGDGIELQKFVGHQGFHDDKTRAISIYLVPATEKGLPKKDWPIELPSNVEWMPLENESKFYRKKWFDGCTDVKVFMEEKIVMGSYYGKVTSPIFIITDIPGASGCYLLKLSELSD